MLQYIGTKRVQARPMNRAEYSIYRGWILPIDEDGCDTGFLIEYMDGGKPNHPAHTGYVSWCPTEQFEKTYRQVSASTLPPHQQRVVEEHADLKEKVTRLQAFTDTPIFAGLPKAECNRLYRQLVWMEAYRDVLAERIAAF